MAFPVVPVLIIAALGAGALLFGRGKPSEGALTPTVSGRWRVLPRGEAARVPFIGTEGTLTKADDPEIIATITASVKAGSRVMLAIEDTASKQKFLKFALVSKVVPTTMGMPIYDGAVVDTVLYTDPTMTSPLAQMTKGGPAIGTRLVFGPHQVLEADENLS